MSWKTIYLTGAPAAGKSSVTKRLSALKEGLAVWEYGARLTEYLSNVGSDIGSQDELRSKSSRVATAEHILALDTQLLKWVAQKRSIGHVIIDSHPVTKEHYGYRVTAFAAEQIQALLPDEIWVLFTPPDIAISRIAADAAGRPAVTLEEARLHTYLQGSVAVSYGISIGKPVYFFDSNKPIDDLTQELAARLQ